MNKTNTLKRLASTVSQQPSLTPHSPVKNEPVSARQPFVQKYKTLVWSNPEAQVEVFIRKALLQPDFTVLLDAAEEFGVSKLQTEWRVLEDEGTIEAQRAAPVTKRMLRHMGARF